MGWLVGGRARLLIARGISQEVGVLGMGSNGLYGGLKCIGGAIEGLALGDKRILPREKPELR